MVSLLAFKVLSLILLATTGTVAAASLCYVQLRTDEFNNEITRTSTEANSREKDLNNLKASLDALEQKVSELQTNILQLQQLNGQQTDDIQQLQTQLSQLQNTLDALQTDLSELQTSNSELTTQVNQLQQEIQRLQDQIRSLQGLSGEVLIGALLSLSGELSSIGPSSLAAIRLAVDDVNQFLSEAGAGWSIRVIAEDDRTEPNAALARLQSLHARGVQFVVGPQFSGAISFLKDYANNNKIVIVSQSSSRPALGVPNDYIFRLAPNDTAQAPAIARSVLDTGVKVAVEIYRDDTFGNGLAQAVRASLLVKGGSVHSTEFKYDPALTNSGNVASIVSALNNEVSNLLSTRPASEIGVVLLSFEEGSLILNEAQNYPNLKAVRWFGSDGTAQSGEITNDSMAAQFANATGFPNSLFTGTPSEKYFTVKDRIETALGREPDQYALVAYDAVWTIALSLLLVDKYDSEAVKRVFPQVAETYMGSTGDLKLNSAGDRLAADYGLWVVRQAIAGWEWAEAGIYNSATDTITPNN